ncbi:MAG TPA: response regulator transcription factor [Symbiobacteriaceae bacterium]|nr:response regulator transcription factor [Symbiobacteriaceae bacterium]
MQEARVLIVDDDDAIADVLATYLKRESIQTGRAADGHQALAIAETGDWQLILLDVMLPGPDGFEVCRHLRARGIDVPILFLTARSDEIDQVLGLGLGADDYIMKPFSGVALVARVKAHLRRYRELKQATRSAAEDEILRFPGLTISLRACEVRRDGHPVSLTAREFALLRFLAENRGRVLTKGQIYRNVWGEEYYADDNTVMVHIRRLREKIEPDPANPQYVVTVRGLGYRFSEGG